MSVEVLPRVIRHRGSPVDAPLLKYEMLRRGLTTVTLARLSGVSRTWVITRALNGHPISVESLRKISKALAKAPVVDRGLLVEVKPSKKSSQLEED